MPNCNSHSTRAETYRVIINTLKGLPRTQLDAAWGLTGLFSLYAIRIFCTWGSKKWPRRRKLSRWSLVCTMLIFTPSRTYLLLHLRTSQRLRNPHSHPRFLVILPSPEEQVWQVPHQDLANRSSWVQTCRCARHRPRPCQRPSTRAPCRHNHSFAGTHCHLEMCAPF